MMKFLVETYSIGYSGQDLNCEKYQHKGYDGINNLFNLFIFTFHVYLFSSVQKCTWLQHMLVIKMFWSGNWLCMDKKHLVHQISSF